MTNFDGFLTNNNAVLINFESIYDNDPYLQKFTEDSLKSVEESDYVTRDIYVTGAKKFFN